MTRRVIDHDEVRRLYLEGKSEFEIACAIGHPKPSIHNIIKRGQEADGNLWPRKKFVPTFGQSIEMNWYECGNCCNQFAVDTATEERIGCPVCQESEELNLLGIRYLKEA